MPDAILDTLPDYYFRADTGVSGTTWTGLAGGVATLSDSAALVADAEPYVVTDPYYVTLPGLVDHTAACTILVLGAFESDQSGYPALLARWAGNGGISLQRGSTFANAEWQTGNTAGGYSKASGPGGLTNGTLQIIWARGTGTDIWLRDSHREGDHVVGPSEANVTSVSPLLGRLDVAGTQSCRFRFRAVAAWARALSEAEIVAIEAEWAPTPAKVQDVTPAVTGTVSTATATTLTYAYTGLTKPQVGDTVVVYGARDTLGTDAASSNATTNAGTFSDGVGNTYSVMARTSTTVGAAGGVAAAMFFSKLTVPWPAGTNTLTWTMPGAPTTVVARAMRIEHWRRLGSLRGWAGASAATAANANSVTYADGQAGDVLLGLQAWEYSKAAAMVGDSDTVNGTWSALQQAVSHGTNAAAVKVGVQYKALTATGSQTHNSNNGTTATDSAGILAAFQPEPPDAAAVVSLWEPLVMSML